MKRLQIPQKIVYKKFYVYEKIYVHEIAAVILSKIYFPKNAKKPCKPNVRIWSHLPKKSLMENFIFCAVRDLNRD